MTKKDAIALYRDRLENNAAWAVKGMLRIFAEQTSAEQETEQTTEHNGVGYTGVDAELLTSYSKQYLAKGYLSPKQMKYVHKKMPKYAGQLLKLSDAAKVETLAA
jgi:hypothetical protein